MWTRQNNVHIFDKFCLPQSERTDKHIYKTRNVVTTYLNVTFEARFSNATTLAKIEFGKLFVLFRSPKPNGWVFFSPVWLAKTKLVVFFQFCFTHQDQTGGVLQSCFAKTKGVGFFNPVSLVKTKRVGVFSPFWLAKTKRVDLFYSPRPTSGFFQSYFTHQDQTGGGFTVLFHSSRPNGWGFWSCFTRQDQTGGGFTVLSHSPRPNGWN